MSTKTVTADEFAAAARQTLPDDFAKLAAQRNPCLSSAPTTEAAKRKAQPLGTGVLAYFPDALTVVSQVSKAGNDQHNPGKPLHWDRSKSQDHFDCLMRHVRDHVSGAPVDTDGMPHLGKAAWRALAWLQVELEKAPK